MGKGGAIISEMRNVTRASIRILSEANLPKVAAEDDEMVQVNNFNNIMCMCASFCPIFFNIIEIMYFDGWPDHWQPRCC